MSAIHDFRSIMKEYLASANGWLQDVARGFGSNAEHADYKTMDSALEKVAVCLRCLEQTRKDMRAYERNAKKKEAEWKVREHELAELKRLKEKYESGTGV